MADKNYVVSLTVDDSGAVAAVNQMTTALDKADTSSQSLKAQLREMQAQLAKLDIGSAEFQKLSQEAGKLKDQINDASEAVRANAGGAFEQLGNNAGLLATRLANLDFEGAAQSAKALGSTLASLTFEDLTKGAGALVKGLGEVALSILKNPLILLGGVIAGIVIYWDELNEAVKRLNPELERVKKLNEDLNAEIKAQSQSVGKQTAQINALFNAVQDETKAESERKAALDAINKLYPDVFKNQDIDINNTSALTAGKLQLIKAIEAEAKATAAKTLLEKQYQKQFELQVQLQEQQLKASEAQRKEAEIVANTSRNTAAEVEQFTLKVTQAGNETSNALAAVAATQNELNAVTKNVLDVQKIVGDSLVAAAIKEVALKKETVTAKTELKQKELQAEISISDLMAQLTADDAAEIEKNNEELAARVRAIWEKAYALSAQAQQTQADEIKAIQDELDVYLDEKGKSAQELELQKLQDAYFEKKTLLENAGQDTTALTEKYNQQVADINKKYYDQEIALAEAKKEKQIQLVNSGLDTLVALNNAFEGKTEAQRKKAFNRNKALQIAQTIATTYQSATTAYASQLIPGDPTSPVRGSIAAAFAIAAGLANVAKISQQKYDGGNAGGVGGGGGNVPSPGGDGGGNVGTVPTFNALNLGVLQNRPEQTPKAYVLAQDVSSAVEARDKVRDLARIN